MIKFDHSFVFTSLHLLFPNKDSSKLYCNIVSLPWAPAFFNHSTSFASTNAKPIVSG